MGKFLEEIGVLRPIQYVVLMNLDRSPIDRSFIVPRWSSHSHTFIAVRGEFCPSLEDVFMLTGLSIIGDYHTVDTLVNEGERLLEICIIP